MSDGKVVIETDLDPSGIEQGISKVNKVASSGLRATTAAITAVSAALMGAGGYAVKVGSDFEAGMSKVAAISGASGSDLEALSSKAKEMGASTKFSATEAASAMQYMAMAGWDTSAMLDGISGIMSLAAADGLDLATTSDIVTDALTAFGLTASDSGHFADVLATASSSANTNVSMLGESFKYVGPIAGALKYSVEDTSLALGLMANASIKGSMAGTSLKTALANMASPTDNMAAVMNQYGISLTNADGSMKSLGEVIEVLRGSIGGLDEATQTAAASTLFGKEAMAGMLAIINASPADYDKLKVAISNADGAAAAMADTMQDNLQGQITILKSGLEGLGIAIYEHMDKPLRSAAKAGIGYVEKLSKAFKNSGFKGLVEEAGDIFAEITVKAAEQAPKMIDAGVDVIKSFVSGIVKNKDRLYDAAVDIASTLANGLAKLLPKQLNEPAQKAIEGITRSFKTGGLKEAGQTIIDVFGDLIEIVGNIASVALPPLASILDFVGQHSNLLIVSIEGLGAAFLAFKAAAKIDNILTKVVSGFGAAKTAAEFYAIQMEAATYTGRMYDAQLTVSQTLVGLFTGKITAATAAESLMTGATAALNVAMAALPLVAVAGAVGAIVVAVESNKRKYEELGAVTDLLTESEHKHIDAANESYESYQRMAETRQNTIDATMNEYGVYESLSTELRGITDENGNIKAGYEERAAVITGTLQEALGIEISTVDGVIQNYGELIGTLDLVIAKQKAQAVQAAYQEEMAAAYKNSNEALTKYNTLVEEGKGKTDAVADAQKAYNEALKNVKDNIGARDDVQERYAAKLVETEGALKSATKAQEDNAQAVQNAKSEFEGYQQTMQTYNELTAALASENADQIETALAKIQTSYKTAATATAEELTAQSMTFQTNLQSIQDGTVTATKEFTAEIAEMAASSLNELSQMSGGIPAALESLGPETSAAIINSLKQANIDGLLSEESKAALDSFIAGFEGLSPKTQEAWSQAWFGALQGLEGYESLKNPATEGANAFLDSLHEALQVHSPSQAVAEIFSNVWPGAEQGLQTGKEGALSKATEFVTEFLGKFTGSNMGETLKGVGAKVMSLFGVGVSSQSANSRSAGQANADAANSGAGSVNPTNTGGRFGGLLGAGISAMSGFLHSVGYMIAGNANSGAGSVNPSPTGSIFGSNFASGISSTSGGALGAGSEIASSAEAGADTADSYSVGSNFGSGFVSGIGAWVSSAAQKAAELAAAAYNSAKSLLGIKSPSRKMREVGKYFGEGFELGIEDMGKTVEKAAQGMSKTALSGVDIRGLAEKMRATVAAENAKIASTIATKVEYKVIGQTTIEDAQRGKDLDALADKMVDAFERAGFKFKVGTRDFARLVREV